MNRDRLIALGGWIAFLGNLMLAAVKLVCGIITGSLGVLGDGIDTACDAGIGVITLAASRVISRPSDKDHPWGHGRAETTATLALTFILFFSGAQVCLAAARNLIIPERIALAQSGIALAVTAVSIAGKLLLSLSQDVIGKRAASPMILVNARNMRNDVIVSLSVLGGLCLERFLGLRGADSVAAFLVGLLIIKDAVMSFRETNMELMDGSANTEQYKRLFEALKTVSGVYNPHRVRIRKIASRFDIDLDIEAPGEITLTEAHELAEHVEQAIRKAIPGTYDIMVHVEPRGVAHRDEAEQFGLSERDVE
ncbi:MAG: cation diffusion facilitator family transporter [Spirochaetaceae bacterium]|jgi:cation diffusion facilitator family transporter|nr:cation diffusion facilitator family transporter [Spirochaetaceae bacterium]